MNKKTIIIFIIIISIILLMFFYLSKNYYKKNEGGVKLLIDKNAKDYQEIVHNNEKSKGIEIPGITSITVDSKSTIIDNIDLYNPDENEEYYLTYEIWLKDSNELLYKSDLIPPSKHIQTIELNRLLDIGIYDAIIHVQPYLLDKVTKTNNANLNTKLIVK